MKKENLKVVRFWSAIEKGFFVDAIMFDDGLTEFWLGHKDYGVKDMIYGVTESNDAAICDIAELSMNKVHRTFYRDRYMD